jgi:hypothetical protein
MLPQPHPTIFRHSSRAQIRRTDTVRKFELYGDIQSSLTTVLKGRFGT